MLVEDPQSLLAPGGIVDRVRRVVQAEQVVHAPHRVPARKGVGLPVGIAMSSEEKPGATERVRALVWVLRRVRPLEDARQTIDLPQLACALHDRVQRPSSVLVQYLHSTGLLDGEFARLRVLQRTSTNERVLQLESALVPPAWVLGKLWWMTGAWAASQQGCHESERKASQPRTVSCVKRDRLVGSQQGSQ